MSPRALDNDTGRGRETPLGNTWPLPVLMHNLLHAPGRACPNDNPSNLNDKSLSG